MIFGALLVAYLGLSLWMAYGYVRPPRFTSPSIPGFESVEIQGPGYPLPIWVSPGFVQKREVFLLVHGYGGDAAGWKPIAERLVAQGYGVVIPEMRGHGRSRVGTVTFGPGESREVAAAAKWVRAQSTEARLVGVGLSLGGAAVLLAAGQEPGLIDGVVVEGTFARLNEVTARQLGRVLPGGSVILWPMSRLAAMMAGVNPSAIEPAASARSQRDRPMLVIHAAEDRLAPRLDAERIAQAAGAEIWTVPTARHAQASVVAPEEYVARLVQVMGRTAKAPPSRS